MLKLELEPNFGKREASEKNTPTSESDIAKPRQVSSSASLLAVLQSSKLNREKDRFWK